VTEDVTGESNRALRESLGAYVLGQLDPEEEAALRAHLATCGECRFEWPSCSRSPGPWPVSAAGR